MIDYYRDNTVALEALKAGQFDFWIETSAKNWATAYDTPAVRDGRLIREEIANHNPTGMQGFIFNLRRPLFQDAARYARPSPCCSTSSWNHTASCSTAPTSAPTAISRTSERAARRPAPSADELKLPEPWRGQLPAQVFEAEYRPPQSDGSGVIREQRRRAFELLQEAGWRLEKDRMLDATGQPVSIEFLLAQVEFERVLLPYKRNLASLGIELQIRRADVSQYINRLRSRDFDMVVGSFGQSSSPGNEQREYWHSDQLRDNPGSRNLIGLKDPAIDALVEGLIAADSRASLIAHTRAWIACCSGATTWCPTGTSRPGGWHAGTISPIRPSPRCTTSVCTPGGSATPPRCCRFRL